MRHARRRTWPTATCPPWPLTVCGCGHHLRPAWAGFLYLAVVLDTLSRGIVGWAMAAHLRTQLVLDALNMALGQRRPAAAVFIMRIRAAKLDHSSSALHPGNSGSH